MNTVCPNCNDIIVIDKINCGIFRHGVIKRTGKNINPHASKKTCEKYIKQKLIYGCGKPFQVIVKDDIIKTEICDYI